jgi:hypothetical protein
MDTASASVRVRDTSGRHFATSGSCTYRITRGEVHPFITAKHPGSLAHLFVALLDANCAEFIDVRLVRSVVREV